MTVMAQIPWPQMGVIAALVVVLLAMLTYLWRCKRVEMDDRVEERDWRARESQKQRTWQGNHMGAQTEALQQVALSLSALQQEQRTTIQEVIRTCPGPKASGDDSKG